MMAVATSTRVQVDIVDGASAKTGLSKVACDHIASMIGSALATLAKDLTIPTTFDVAVGVDSGDPSVIDDLAVMSITIGGNLIRRTQLPEGADASGIGDLATAGLMASRTALLTPDTVAAVWTSWRSDWAEPESFLSMDQVSDLLTNLVSLSISLDDGRDYARREYDAKHAPNGSEILERVLSESASIGIWISLDPRNIKGLEIGDAAGEFFDELQLREFDETGVVFPQPQFVSDKDLGPDRIQVKINDLRFPVMRWFGVADAWVEASAGILSQFGLRADRVLQPYIGREFAAVRKADLKKPPIRDNFAVLEPVQGLVELVDSLARNSIPSFVTREAVREAVDAVSQSFPSTASEALEQFGLDRLTTILRAAARNGMPLGDLPSVLDELLAMGEPFRIDLDGTLEFSFPVSSTVAFIEADHPPSPMDADDYAFNLGLRMSRRFHALPSPPELMPSAPERLESAPAAETIPSSGATAGAV